MDKNNKKSPDPELDDILDNSEIIEAEPLIKAKKYLTLMEEFDIVEGSNMEENLTKHQEEIFEIKKDIKTEVPDDLNISIVKAEELLKDFILIRETLREDIKNTRVVLDKLCRDLGMMDAEDMNGQVVMAFSDIKKSNVLSMKLLMESYEKVAETQLKVKKLAQELEMRENNNNPAINNAIFVGSPSDLLASLQKS